MVDALLLSDKEKTFQFSEHLPSLPVPPLQQTLDKYLQSVRPFVTPEEYKKTQAIVREFGAGIGKDIQLKLCEKAKYMRNWLEKWWEDYAYLDTRHPISLLDNMAGPGPYYRDIWPAEEGTQIQRSSMLFHYMVSFWKILREERLAPQKDGQGNPICMAQFYRIFNTCRLPGVSRDKIIAYFKTESIGPAPSNIIVTCRGRLFNIECLDEDGEIFTPPEFERQLQAIRDQCDSGPIGQAICNLTTDNRTEWAKMRSRLIARNPNNYEILEKIQQSIIFFELTDQQPRDPTELAILGLGGNGDGNFSDKSLSLSIHKNGLICSNCEHSPFDAMVLVVSTFYVHSKIREMGGKWTGNAQICNLPPLEELTFDLDDILVQKINSNRIRFAKLCNEVEVETSLFTDYGKAYLKSVKVHPDTHVQMALQYAYYRRYRKPAPTYETATTRRFFHGRTGTMRSCTVEAMDWCQAMMDSSVNSATRLKLFLRAVDRHTKLMGEAQMMNGCDRHMFGLYITCLEEEIPIPEIFTDPANAKSGGGGNFILSTSSLGYTLGCGGVSPMCKNGYGCFYRMAADEIGTFFSSWTEDTDTSAKQFTADFHKSLRDMQALVEHKNTMARL